MSFTLEDEGQPENPSDFLKKMEHARISLVNQACGVSRPGCQRVALWGLLT
jgi:hypothetical protein